MLGVFFIKAASYKMVEENSKYKDSYFYSIEHKSNKSFCHASMLGGEGKPHDDFEPGKCDIVNYLQGHQHIMCNSFTCIESNAFAPNCS